MEIYAPVVAGKVRKYREEKGYTQAHLAELAGVSRDTIAKLETMRSNPTMGTLVHIATALGVMPSQLLEETEAEGSHDAM